MATHPIFHGSVMHCVKSTLLVSGRSVGNAGREISVVIDGGDFGVGSGDEASGNGPGGKIFGLTPATSEINNINADRVVSVPFRSCDSCPFRPRRSHLFAVARR